MWTPARLLATPLLHFLLLLTLAAADMPNPKILLSPSRGGDGHDAGSGGAGNKPHPAIPPEMFNFTPSGIEWPGCMRACLHHFFRYFPAAVAHPLCVSMPYYDNVTACVADNCTAYDQGVYSVVADAECPAERGPHPVQLNGTQGVRDLLRKYRGYPLTCEGVENRTVACQAEETGSGAASLLAGKSMAWMGSTLLLAVGFGALV